MNAAKKAKLTSPAIISGVHNLSDFDCEKPSLNFWLVRHALEARQSRTANTFVVCRGRKVMGYFSLANACVDHAATTAKVRRNTPDPIPATLLARLAVDKTEKGKGLGRDLLIHASKKVLQGARLSAARLLIVHPLDEEAGRFYQKFGFRPLKGETTAMYIPLETLVDGL